MRRLMALILIFVLGFIASMAFSTSVYSEKMSSFFSLGPGNLEESLSLALADKPSPADRIKEEQIHVKKDSIIIDLKNAEWAKFTDTNSMDPVIDAGANAIEIVPENPENIQAGDIISYITPYSNDIIIHRVVEIGNDGEWYAKVKGDNIPSEDPGKVRFSQIQRVVVAIIY